MHGGRGAADRLASLRLAAAVAAMLVVASACGSDGDGGGGGAPSSNPTPTPTATPGFANTLGFVVSSFGFVFPETVDACPGGYNRGPIERRAAGDPPLADDCLDPEASADPDFRTLDAPGILDGFDLDDMASTRTGGEGCAHDDFSGAAGEAGFDDQLWRAIGCIRGFQKGDIVESVVDGAVRDGSMTILVDVRNVDDPRDDDSVEVQVFSSEDAPPLGGDGSVLPFGTLNADPNPRYHGSAAAGRIRDGILLAGPMDIRLRLNIQIVVGDLVFRDAWVRIETLPDGTASGRIYGYSPIDEVYDIFGAKAGTIGGKEAIGYTCTGLHAALVSQADGHFDPETGTCTSLSTAYRFAGVRAFVAR